MGYNGLQNCISGIPSVLLGSTRFGSRAVYGTISLIHAAVQVSRGSGNGGGVQTIDDHGVFEVRAILLHRIDVGWSTVLGYCGQMRCRMCCKKPSIATVSLAHETARHVTQRSIMA